MSARVPPMAEWRIAVREAELDTVAKAVTLVIGVFMEPAGEAWPSKELIATRAGLSVSPSGTTRGTDRAIDRAEAAGVLFIERSVGGSGHSNHYFARFPTPHRHAGLLVVDILESNQNPARGNHKPRTNPPRTPHPGAGEEFEELEEARRTPTGVRVASLSEECLVCRETFVHDEPDRVYCDDCFAAVVA